jgi:hypothetical protein
LTGARIEGDAQAILDLPFVHETGEGDICFWSIEPTGDQSADIDKGECFARLALAVSREFELPELIATVLRDMIISGNFTAVEAGFVATVASAARSGSMN